MRAIAAACVIAGLLHASDAVACLGKNVIFEDQFKDDSGGWEVDSTLQFGPTGLTIKFEPSWESYPKMNAAFAVKDGDLCIDVAFPQQLTNKPSVALRFWVVDGQNYYVFQISPAGYASMHRMLSNRWSQIFSQETTAIKKGPGATNRLRVTLKGNLVTTYINDQKIRDQRAQPPAGDSRFGFYLQLGEAAKDEEARTFKVTNFKVTDLP
jgi:hypothetical protein